MVSNMAMNMVMGKLGGKHNNQGGYGVSDGCMP